MKMGNLRALHLLNSRHSPPPPTIDRPTTAALRQLCYSSAPPSPVALISGHDVVASRGDDAMRIIIIISLELCLLPLMIYLIN